MNDVVRRIVEKAVNFSATDAYRAEYKLADVAADPITVNSRLGTYTNFVNLADCSALALPAALRADGLPFGITLIAPAWQDATLTAFGKNGTAALT